jgi:hypothetical protein
MEQIVIVRPLVLYIIYRADFTFWILKYKSGSFFCREQQRQKLDPLRSGVTNPCFF